MKSLWFFVLLLVPVWMLAQGAVGDKLTVDFEPDYSMNGIVGAVTIDGVTYSQIRLMPEIELWKFGFGFDLDFLMNGDGYLRKEDWDEWQDYVKKVFYVRFAKREDPFYFRVINIPDYTLANGLIFDDYSNMLRYPDIRNFGTYMGINIPKIGLGFEAYTHNVIKNQILGGRVQLKPFDYLNRRGPSNFSVGFNVGIDRDQYGKYEDKDNDHIPDVYDQFPDDGSIWVDSDGDGVADNIDIDLDGDNSLDHPNVNPYVNVVYPGIANYYGNLDTQVVSDSLTAYSIADPVFVWSLDYKVPIIDYGNLQFYNYGEFAHIDNYGSGLSFPAIGAKFLLFDAKLELRNFTDKFLPGFFDNLYDDQRSEYHFVEDDVDGHRLCYLSPKDSKLDAVKASMGWYGSLTANLNGIFRLKLAFQDMYGENVTTGKSLTGTFEMDKKFIRKLKEASLTYSQTNMSYISFKHLRNPGVEFSGKLAYEIAKNANLVGKYHEHYADLNGDGIIEGKDEIRSNMSLGVEFRY
ncbi:MAG TPA: hypothetical protein PL124_11265 [Candidatus Cloacimonadota bacterium]|nr:hypothetical protein [Candidatus Cloacimonadota bacterium]HPS39985.1 hypothetical protein [Candidatus Cloacimonadota bacterium]